MPSLISEARPTGPLCAGASMFDASLRKQTRRAHGKNLCPPVFCQPRAAVVGLTPRYGTGSKKVWSKLGGISDSVSPLDGFARYTYSKAMASQRSSDLTKASLVAVTQTAVGCGIGLLIAGKLQRPTQKTTAATLLSLGVLLAVPAVVQTVLRVWQNPESERGARRRLDSIRLDPGLTDETEVY